MLSFRILGFALYCMASAGYAYTYVQVGVDSNLHIDSGRIIFAQSDGSLTVLALETGVVLQRDKSRDFSGELVHTPHGILVLNYGTVTLLHPTTLKPIWDTTFHYDPNLTDDVLVSYDGNGRVQCRTLKDGTIRWTYELPGALEVVTESGRVLVHRASTFDDSIPTMALLSLDTGKEIFRKHPEQGIHWDTAFFDGTNVYVETGRFEGKRQDFRIERMAVWNTRGEEIDSIVLTADLRKKLRFGDETFDLSGKTFSRGRVYPSRESIRHGWLGKVANATPHTNGNLIVHETTYNIGGDVTWTERSKSSLLEYGNGDAHIEIRTKESQCTGFLPYLDERGRVSALAQTNGMIFVGTSLGQVECIKAATGESLWLYVFPTLRHTMSFSSHGMPPMMSQAAAIFRRENRSPPKSGFQLINGKPSAPRIIRDPSPIKPFEKLPLYLAIAWSGAAIPLLLLATVLLSPRIRRFREAVWPVTLVLSLGIFMFYGRVSPGSSITLRVAILTCLILGAISTVKCYRSRQWVSAVVLTFILVAVTLWSLPMLLMP